MSKAIAITLPDGSKLEFTSTILKGYHIHYEDDKICITKKELFKSEEAIICVPIGDTVIENSRCTFCETLNPTQRSNQQG
jgi:hypothetical protein